MHQPIDIIANRPAQGKEKPRVRLGNREALLRRLWADHNPDGGFRHEGR